MAELPESRLALPLGQTVQPAEPDNDLYWPAGQAMQVSVVALVRVPLKPGPHKQSDTLVLPCCELLELDGQGVQLPVPA